MNTLLILCLLAACVSAAVLEARCMRDPCIPDNPLSMAGRRIKIVGYLILGLRFGDLLITGTTVYAPAGLALLMVAFSDCIRCANRLALPASAMGGSGQ